VKSILRRLQSLERHAGHRTTTEGLATVRERALQIFSAADRELLPEVNLLLTRCAVAELGERYRTVWDRWDGALAMATTQAGFPFLLSAADLRL
jgi:hypothetical protein